MEPVEASSLRALGLAEGLVVGAAVGAPPPRRTEAWDAVLRQQFGSVTPEWVLKWAPVQPKPRPPSGRS